MNENKYPESELTELSVNQIPHKSQPKVSIKVILELKSTKEINNEHVRQMIPYLKATNIKIGLILNFGKSKLEIKRIIL